MTAFPAIWSQRVCICAMASALAMFGTSCATDGSMNGDSFADILAGKMTPAQAAPPRGSPATYLLPIDGPVAPVETNQQARAGVGDRISVTFFHSPPKDQPAEYRLECMDEIAIHVAGHENYSADLTVRPDGRVSFYQVGDLDVRGKTVPQVQRLLTEQFQKVIPAADISVFLKHGHVLVEDFLETLKSNQQLGTTRNMTVRPDGYINLPLVGEVLVLNRTQSELSRDIENGYDNMFGGGLDVAVNLTQPRDEFVAVLGEVRNPGMHQTLGQPLAPAYLLALAGGVLDTGNLRKAVIVKYRSDGRMTTHLAVENPGMTLNSRDILIVPKSGVANANRMVEQYLRRMLPLNLGAGAYYDLNE